MSAVAASKPPPRGTFVVFEGVDRAWKSTQCKLLAEGLRKRGREATLINFPDRTTGVGQLIDKYLRKEVELDDRAVHLMFSANRWEAAQSIKDLLESGEVIVHRVGCPDALTPARAAAPRAPRARAPARPPRALCASHVVPPAFHPEPDRWRARPSAAGASGARRPAPTSSPSMPR